jgi:hypothetical protein
MARPKSKNPSKHALYMREYRKSKETIDDQIRREARILQEKLHNDPNKAQVLRERRCKRRQDIYRARKVLAVGLGYLTFGGYTMFEEEALHILRQGKDMLRKRDLLAPKHLNKVSKLKGVPQKRSYDTPEKLNAKLRQMMMAAGLQPASPQLIPDEPVKDVFNINRPINMSKKLEEAEKLKAAKAASPEMEAFNAAVENFKNKLASQGSLSTTTPAPEADDPFAGQVFDFSPDKK